MQEENRRSFIKKAGVASAFAAAEFVNLNPRAIGANEKVVLALIGGRNQGRGDALRAIRAGAEIKTFCDIDDAILQKVGPDLRQPGNAREQKCCSQGPDSPGSFAACAQPATDRAAVFAGVGRRRSPHV